MLSKLDLSDYCYGMQEAISELGRSQLVHVRSSGHLLFHVDGTLDESPFGRYAVLGPETDDDAGWHAWVPWYRRQDLARRFGEFAPSLEACWSVDDEWQFGDCLALILSLD